MVSWALSVRLAIMRWAITPRRPVSGMRWSTCRSIFLPSWGAASASRIAACTSASTMRPRGPDPAKVDRSILCSLARRRAMGVARTSPADSDGGDWLAVPPDGAGVKASCIGTAASSPISSTYPRTSRIGTTCPSSATRLTTPATGAEMDWITLSDSISRTSSPVWTLAPSSTSQRATVPSIIIMPSWGIRNSTLTLSTSHGLLDSPPDSPESIRTGLGQGAKTPDENRSPEPVVNPLSSDLADDRLTPSFDVLLPECLSPAGPPLAQAAG